MLYNIKMEMTKVQKFELSEYDQMDDSKNPIGECPICIEKYTKRQRKQIECAKCNYISCSECCKNYILNSINEAHCMNCKHPWDRSFLIENMTYKFINEDYKEFLQNIFYEREKSNMEPAYQLLESYKKGKELEKEVELLQVEENDLYNKLLEIENEHFRIKNKISTMKYNIKRINNGEIVDIEAKKTKFFGHCPNEECKGVVTEKLRCNICNQRVCKSCKEKLGDEPDALKLHACNPDTLETLKNIKSETKNCPKCKVAIYKIEGCNQMFCTQCNIAFCWRTGEIYRGRNVHNPHYFEWLNGTDATPDDNLCGNDENDTYMRRLVRGVYMYNCNVQFVLNSIYTFIDLSGRIIPNLRFKLLNENKITNLKVKYLTNEKTEKQFKRDLQNEDIKIQRTNEQINIYESLCSAFCVIIKGQFGYKISRNNMKNEKELYESLDKLIEFSETLQKEYHKKYKTKCGMIYWKNKTSKRLSENKHIAFITI